MPQLCPLASSRCSRATWCSCFCCVFLSLRCHLCPCLLALFRRHRAALHFCVGVLGRCSWRAYVKTLCRRRLGIWFVTSCFALFRASFSYWFWHRALRRCRGRCARAVTVPFLLALFWWFLCLCSKILSRWSIRGVLQRARLASAGTRSDQREQRRRRQTQPLRHSPPPPTYTASTFKFLYIVSYSII